MGRTCCVQNCRTEKKGHSKHRFPADEVLRSKWIQNIQVLNKQSGEFGEKSFLCGNHFEKECLQKKYSWSSVTLKKGSLPTLFPNMDLSETHNLEILYDEDEGYNKEVYQDCKFRPIPKVTYLYLPIKHVTRKSMQKSHTERGVLIRYKHGNPGDLPLPSNTYLLTTNIPKQTLKGDRYFLTTHTTYNSGKSCS